MDWDHELGSNLLDQALVQHFTAEFAAKHKFDLDTILNNAKVMAKMKKQVQSLPEEVCVLTVISCAGEAQATGIRFDIML